MTPKQDPIITFLLIKYGSIELIIAEWIKAETALTDEEAAAFEDLVLCMPNVNLIKEVIDDRTGRSAKRADLVFEVQMSHLDDN